MASPADISHSDVVYAGDIPGSTIPHDDATYTGDVSASPISMDYWRTKAQEFQSTLNALDQAYIAALRVFNSGIDPDNSTGIADSIAEYESQRYTLKVTAEAINLGAATVNAAGGRFPPLAIPQTLGLVPLLMPAAAIAALGAAGALIVWGKTWLDGVNQRLMLAQALDAQATPEQRATLAASVIQTQNAISESESMGIGALAPLLKWGAIAVGAYFAWRAFQSVKTAT